MSEGFARVDVVPFERRADPSHAERAVLIWCDGILVRSRSNQRTPSSADDLVVDVGRAATLRRYGDEGFRLLGLSWQPDIAEGKRTAADVDAVFAKMNELLGLAIEVVLRRTAAGPPRCWCRKPLPGLGVLLIYRHHLDPGALHLRRRWAPGRRLRATVGASIPFCTRVLRRRRSVTPSAFLCAAGTSPCRRVRRNRRSVAVQVPVEPVELPVQALDEVLRLARAGEVVVLAREEHDLARSSRSA